LNCFRVLYTTQYDLQNSKRG